MGEEGAFPTPTHPYTHTSLKPKMAGRKRPSQTPQENRAPVDPAELSRRLDALYPEAECSLEHQSPLELLISTILSAQCTDERVNQVTKTLFRKYHEPEDYLRVPQEELEQDIHSTGFFRNKAKAIRGACRRILEEHGGEVPATMEELLQLPGVARKTANCVLGSAFGVAEGVVVDTHVQRLSRLLGLSQATTPEKIERDLMERFPRERWIRLSHQLILHGRSVCSARKPNCPACPLNDICPSAKSNGAVSGPARGG
jgi:endonuclease III